MEAPVLNANYRIRDGKNSANRTRNSGKVPAVVYDISLNKMIELDKKGLDAVLKDYGRYARVNLNLDGTSIKAMIKDVQYDPVTRQPIHIDLKPVHQDDKIRTHIPIRFTGTEYLGRSGGVVQKQKQEIEVQCTADSVPKFINADLSNLAVGESFKVFDLEVSSELSIITKPSEVLVTLLAANNYADPANDSSDSIE